MCFVLVPVSQLQWAISSLPHDVGAASPQLPQLVAPPLLGCVISLPASAICNYATSKWQCSALEVKGMSVRVFPMLVVDWEASATGQVQLQHDYVIHGNIAMAKCNLLPRLLHLEQCVQVHFYHSRATSTTALLSSTHYRGHMHPHLLSNRVPALSFPTDIIQSLLLHHGQHL